MSKPISDTSRKAYEASLRQLKTLIDAPYEDFEDIQEAIESSDYSDSTKSLMYNAVLRFNRQNFSEEVINKYKNMIMIYITKSKTKKESQIMNEKEQEKFLSWPEVLQVREKVKADINDFDSYMNYIIVCLYTYFPPRRLDYGDMKITSKAPKDPSGNFLVITQRQCKFIFTDYKTDRTYGIQIFTIQEPLAQILRDFVESYNLEYLLINNKGEPFGSQALSSRVINIFKKYTDTAVGVSVLRHSFVSYMRKDEKPMLEQMEIANQMAHGIYESMTYRKLNF